jgi:adenosylmethionine-8-amino-7-oxononanoate aminotransferase
MHNDSHLLHRQLRGSYPLAASAAGCWITDAAGKRYLDASGGAAVSCLGHGHPDVLAAMHAQVDRIAYAHTSFFSTEVAERLADTLVGTAPAGISHVYLVSGGSEAVEAALKLARQYFVEKGEPQRARFIARRNSYHGNTLGALAVGGNAWRRRQFAPLLIDVEHVAPTYAYRDQRADETGEQYGARLAQEFEDTVERVGGENVIAFVAETVGGATSGALTPPPGYFRRIREVCDRYGILLILDEVMCGMGRTGTLHACEQEGVEPDLMAIAKGLVRCWSGRASSMPSRPAPASSSTATRTSGTRSRARRRSRCNRCWRATGWWSAVRPRAGACARRSTKPSGNMRTSAKCAGAASSRRSNWSPTAAPGRRSTRRSRWPPASRGQPWNSA